MKPDGETAIKDYQCKCVKEVELSCKWEGGATNAKLPMNECNNATSKQKSGAWTCNCK